MPSPAYINWGGVFIETSIPVHTAKSNVDTIIYVQINAVGTLT